MCYSLICACFCTHWLFLPNLPFYLNNVAVLQKCPERLLWDYRKGPGILRINRAGNLLDSSVSVEWFVGVVGGRV